MKQRKMGKQKHSSVFHSNQRESSEIIMQSLLHGKRNMHSLHLLFSVQFILFVYYLFLENSCGVLPSLALSLIQFECLNIRIGHELCKNKYPRFICAHNSMVVVV